MAAQATGEVPTPQTTQPVRSDSTRTGLIDNEQSQFK